MTEFWTTYGFYLWLLTTIIIVALGGLCWYTVRQIRKLNQRYTTLLHDVDGETLEDIWLARSEQVSMHSSKLQNLEHAVAQIREQSIQHIGLIRFNPFDDVGGDQSFALALLNGERDGVVVSSIYSRTGGRIYAKPVGGTSPLRALSEEEEMAIALALGQGEPITSSSSSN